MKKWLLVLFIVSTIVACGRQVISIPTVEPQKVKSVDMLSDSTYFSEITTKKYCGDCIYA